MKELATAIDDYLDRALRLERVGQGTGRSARRSAVKAGDPVRSRSFLALGVPMRIILLNVFTPSAAAKSPPVRLAGADRR